MALTCPTRPLIYRIKSTKVIKDTLDVHPTNPQIDIQPTRSYELWIRNVDLVRYVPKPKPTTEQPFLNANPPPLTLPEIYSSTVACTYSKDGKCQGMMAPERPNILHAAFHTSKLKGLHNDITPAPKSFASELPGLLARKVKLERNCHGKKSKILLCKLCRSMCTLPSKNGLSARLQPQLRPLLESRLMRCTLWCPSPIQ